MPALLLSELPEIARTRHHWIVLFRLPAKWPGIAVLLLLIWALLAPVMLIVVVLLLAAAAYLRWQTWEAELIILTTRRIVRVQGVPETTTSEASLRLDRISGVRLIQTVPGKFLDYATIELAAPGNDLDIHELVKIAKPLKFYLALRALVFGDRTEPNADDTATPDDTTTPDHDGSTPDDMI